MGFLDSLRQLFSGDRATGKASGGGKSSFGSDSGGYWIYARCRRCGEPLKARINLANDPSLADDGESWVVRKVLSGSGGNLCFQTVEVTLTFDLKKSKVLSAEAVGGKLLTADEYEALTGTGDE